MNAKQEFIDHIEGHTIKCAFINKDVQRISRISEVFSFNLKEGYTPEEYEEFLNSLDFAYTPCMPPISIYGIVWYEEEGIYSLNEGIGAEGWSKYNFQIPRFLLKNIKEE
jgi:hypothetical protein